MRKANKLSNKLIAILLSASMVFAPVVQSMPVHAAEPVIEEGGADTLLDNTETDEPVADNNDSDNSETENSDSKNTGAENGDTEEVENPEVPDSEDETAKESETAEGDENLDEDILPDESLEAVADSADGSTTSVLYKEHQGKCTPCAYVGSG